MQLIEEYSTNIILINSIHFVGFYHYSQSNMLFANILLERKHLWLHMVAEMRAFPSGYHQIQEVEIN